MAKGLKNFLVAFVFSSVVIGIAALIVMNSISDVLYGSFSKRDGEIAEILNGAEDETAEDESAVPSDNKLSILDGDSFTVLIVMTDYRPDVYGDYMPKDLDSVGDKVGFLQNGFRRYGAHNICICKCSKETGQFVFVPVSPLTKVLTPTGYETLYDAYYDFGCEYFKDKLTAMTGLAIDRYAIINCTEMSSFVAALGAVWATVPCEIFSNGTEYVSATVATAEKVKDANAGYTRFLEACTDYIGPSSMGLLLFDDYSNGVDDELTITSTYCEGVFANFAKFPSDSLAAFWPNIASCLSDTDIDADFLTQHLSLIGAYDISIAAVVNIPGLFKSAAANGDALFEPDEMRTVDALSKYR